MSAEIANISIGSDISVINVKSETYGAVGDGVTNDQAAFLAAMAAAVSTDKPLFVPEGIYDLNGISYTASGKLKIIGQGKDRSILKHITAITCNSDLHVEDVSFEDASSAYVFVLAPTTFANLYLKNVKATNADHAFADATIANSFIFCYPATAATGVESVQVRDCDISYFSAYAFRLRCTIHSGVFENNNITDIGCDFAATGNFGIRCGEQTRVAYANNLTIQNNHIENIYSAYGASSDASEAHAILLWGSDNNILNNTIKNIYGGGRLAANLNGGYDHEAIYAKSTNTLIQGNHIIEGCGALSAGAITVKTNTGVVICNNFVTGAYGTGIYTESPDTTIEDNFISLAGGKTGISHNAVSGIIHGNTISITGVNGTNGIIRDLGTGTTCIISENSIFCETGKGIYALTDVSIVGNKINVQKGIGIYCVGVPNVSIKNNTIIIDGTTVYASSFCISVQGAGQQYGEILNNKLFMNKTRANASDGTAITLYASNRMYIKNNYMYSKGKYVVEINEPTAGGICEAHGNHIVATNAYCFRFNSPATTSLLNVVGNTLEYSTDGASSSALMLSTPDATNANTVLVKGNVFKVDSVISTALVSISGGTYSVDDNEFYMNSAIVGTVPRVITVNNTVANTNINSVSNNKVKGALKAVTFLGFATGATDVGTVRVNHNTTLLTSGALINSADNAVIAATDLIVEDNYVKTTSATGKTIIAAVTPTVNYTASGNIER